ASLRLEAGRQRRLERALDRLLRQPRGDRSLLGDVASEALCLVEPGLLCDNACDEARGERLTGIQAPAAEDHVHRERPADGAREALGAARAGDDPEARLRLAELRRLGSDDQAAAHPQLA